MDRQELSRKAMLRCGIGGNLIAEVYEESMWTSLCKDMRGALLIQLTTGEIFFGDYGGCTQLCQILNSRACSHGGDSVLVFRYSSEPCWATQTPQLFEKHVSLTVLDGLTILSLPVVGSASRINFSFSAGGNCELAVEVKTDLYVPNYTVCKDPVGDVSLSIAVFSRAISALLGYAGFCARDLLKQHSHVYVFENGRFGIVAVDFYDACSNLVGSTSQHRLGENAQGPHHIDAPCREVLEQHYNELVQPHLDVNRILGKFFRTAHFDDFLYCTQLSVATLLE